MVWGNAEEITEDVEAQTVISALVSKYRPVLGSPLSPGPSDVGLAEPDILMALPIETITGRSSGSFFPHIESTWTPMTSSITASPTNVISFASTRVPIACVGESVGEVRDRLVGGELLEERFPDCSPT